MTGPARDRVASYWPNEVVISVAGDADEADRSPDAIQIDLLPG